jgi:CheY-like chemotaxis protein
LRMEHDVRSPPILVVDDESVLRKLSAFELEDAGYTVLEAENAAEALHILEAGTPVALMFTDVNMPGELNGLELARRVHERWPGVRLIVTSGGGKVGPGDVPAQGRFISKPYSLESMRVMVAEMTREAA